MLTLMHKNTPVCECIFQDYILMEIPKIYHPEHAPIGTLYRGNLDLYSLRHWAMGRRIPDSRDGFQEALAKAKIQNPDILITAGRGLSLSDQYWFRYSDEAWEEVNFFHHPFEDSFGSLLFSGKGDGSDLHTPVNTSDGWLRKKWVIAENGKRLLLKGGSNGFHQEPINEFFASEVCKALGFSHIEYRMEYDDCERPYCICENGITDQEDLVPMMDLVRDLPGDPFENYQSFHPEIQKQMQETLILDALIGNTDRHYRNICMVRDAETLRYTRCFPIFDNGTSLYATWATIDIQDTMDGIQKLTGTTFAESLKHVTMEVDLSVLSTLTERFLELYQESKYISNERAARLMDHWKYRLETVQKILHAH